GYVTAGKRTTSLQPNGFYLAIIYWVLGGKKSFLSWSLRQRVDRQYFTILQFHIMNTIQSFNALANCDAKILILGSVPGAASLRANQYYAHPRNTFWNIMEELFGVPRNAPYPKRIRRLCECKIALWDVIQLCVRPGSLDQAIKKDSVVPNNFPEFFFRNADIHSLFFNGAKAEDLYTRLVLPSLPPPFKDIPRNRLPSTSPAHAAMTYSSKLSAWKTVKRTLDQSKLQRSA
ncbi:MAG: DNA-deoxyinosine glycosylase, partial [Nitrospinota bacterium]